ncbi:hypothetical protein D2V17_13775 [Aurantiacibacter xanthus]|uniref:Uncharacterized protein n=1 Tax=Aurantiacibacter xanthus TaxID=1784712 RepID=A0A3A1P6Z4_9SPHN|nr:hypothetical protein [Aurantiacibacter xanthus]RIV83257.1 hypothetical protein D2V17_13775 [Aurantiacibacter xanthus]
MIAVGTETVRGQPVVAMVAVLAVWVSLRLAFWQSPLMLSQAQAEWTIPGALAALPRRLARTGRDGDGAITARYARLETDFRPLVRIELGRMSRETLHSAKTAVVVYPGEPAPYSKRLIRLSPEPAQASEPVPRVSRPSAVASAGPSGDPVFAPRPAAQSRWTASSWLFWRDSNAGGQQAATTPNYGRSQAGVVLAYRLAPESGHRPQLYIRATSALEGPREDGLAAGLSARPVPDVPLRLAAEARVSLRDGTSELRPAVFAVTELAPFALPASMVGEAYAQAGWVGGDFATGFVDAQMRITRALVRSEGFALSAGGGAWAGAQKGTRRLDVGPTVSASFRVSDEVYGRLSADYRVRVAGNAEPASGPALTLSAGF